MHHHPKRVNLRSLIDLGRRSFALFARMGGVDRAMGLAAQAFTAVFPLLIVASATLQGGDGDSFGDVLVRKLHLSGDAADAAREAFPDSGSVEQSISILSVLILLISALSFTRALQRLYEQAWGLEARGMRDTPWGLAWLAAMCSYLALIPALHEVLPPWARFVESVLGSFFLWLATPYLVLARRLPWRRLVPQAVLAAVGIAALQAGSAIYMPRAMASAADQFGTIGFAFTLVSWLFAAGLVIAGTAAVGACVSARPGMPGR